jgi:murein DD-endopeptidase MepM/ murein hydrolase activator NlpD
MRLLPSFVSMVFCFVTIAQAQILIDCLSIACPPDIIVEATSPDGAEVFFSATAMNRCSSQLSVVYKPRPGTTFQLGTNTVTAYASDGRNTESCKFKVIVRDTTAPRILAPRGLKVPCESLKGTRVEFSVTASDAYDTNVSVICTPPSGSLFPKGTNMVQCVTVDEARNRRVLSFPVIVEGDCTAQAECLTLNVPKDISLTVASASGRRVNYTATAEGTCSRIDPTITFDPPSGSVFLPGESIVMVTATQGIYSKKGSFKIILRDAMAPVLSLPADIVVDAQGADGAIVNFSPTATDVVSGNVPVMTEPASGSLFPVGRTAVICEAIDDAGNRSVEGFAVTVRKPQPRITPSATVGGKYEVNWTFNGRPEIAPTMDGPQWAPWTGSILSNGINRTIVLAPTNSTFFVRVPAQPLGFKLDSDKDGVPDREDKCPDTLRGKVVDDCGCSPVQVAKTPEGILNAVHAGIASAQRLLEKDEAFEDVRSKLSAETSSLQSSETLMKKGSITSAANTLSNSYVRLKAARDELAGLVSNYRRIIPRVPEYGDADEDDYQKDERAMALKKVSAVVKTVDTARKSFDFTRTSVTQIGSLSGGISKLDSGGTSFTLDDGLHVEFASSYQDFTATEKGSVSGTGVKFNDGTAYMTASDAPAVQESTGDFSINWVSLRFAPFQRFAGNGPFILHHPKGYFRTNTYGDYTLEHGMRLATSGVMNPPANVYAFGLRLDLGYESTNYNYKDVTLASFLKPGDKPVPFPSDMRARAALTVTKIKIPKTSGGGPGTPEVMETEVYSLFVNSRFAIATAKYATTIFTLEDSPVTSAYGINVVTGLDVIYPLSYYSNYQFSAEAYWPNGNVSTYPQAFPVGMYIPFAINAQDFYVPEFGALSEVANGTDKPSGLRWPRVTGMNNGYPYSYSVGVPGIVRDAISFCNDTAYCNNNAETYYRLPFIGGWPFWKQGQGNCGDFTHKGNSKYAYDMPASLNTEVRAARGGVVTFVREDEYRNCCPDGDCPDDCDYSANLVEITHQDGTRGRYLHMPQNGVIVAEGMYVRRGDVIAKVGNTGYSTGPHLHFEVRGPESGDATQPIRFQMWKALQYDTLYVQDSTLRNCVSPDRGDPLFSNNWSWDESD